MTRGKYKRKAELRRDEHETATTIDTYQRAVARLTQENKELRDRLSTMERNQSAALRKMRAERDEAEGPKVQALTLRFREAIAARDNARNALRNLRDTHERLYGRIVEHFVDDHGLKPLEVQTVLLAWAGAGGRRILADSGEARRADKRGLSGEDTDRLRRARGEARSPEEVERLARSTANGGTT